MWKFIASAGKILARILTVICWSPMPILTAMIGWTAIEAARAGEPICIMIGIATLMLGVLSYVMGARCLIFPSSWNRPLDNLDQELHRTAMSQLAGDIQRRGASRECVRRILNS
jgi:hypothetical protein